MSQSKYSEVVDRAQEYYNSDSADRFYYEIWGGEDIHIGLYESEEEAIATASHRTVVEIAKTIQGWKPEWKCLDIGAGYGGAGRYLAKNYGIHVDCLNLSEVQNERNREKNKEQGLEHLIAVIDASFEDIPEEADSYEVVWSQDAILHSGKRRKVLEEVDRVLKSGGQFVFTDPMQSDDCPEGVLQPVLDRIHLDSLGSPGFYREVAQDLGWEEIGFQDLSHQLVNHYSSVRRELEANRERITEVCGADYVERMKTGLGHWIEAGKNGHLCWGIFHFRRP
jgi:cyclopropane fatty-acyl-phospholipid synthase-like methyltransferase